MYTFDSMGIPSYFSQVIKKYGKIMKPMSKHTSTHFHSLYMDCNSIIYDAVRSIKPGAEFERNVITAVIINIDLYIKSVKPSNTVFIAFDGVAPFAKMNQQRTRRYKGDYMASIDFVKKQDANSWSTSNITPGTNFMNLLSTTISRHFADKKSYYNLKNLIVSGSDFPGEGEHKIFEYIRNNRSDENMLLYGLDSDLIMLTIFHSHCYKNGYIFREAPEFMKSALDIPDGATEPYVLDIRQMCNSLVIEMDCVCNEFRRIYDYVFMCFLLGNDFLPHFPALNIRTHGMDTLIEFYKKFIGRYADRFLINENMTINWRNFKRLMVEISKHEKTFILDEFATRNRNDKRKWKLESEKDREYAFNCVPLIYRSEEKYICPTEELWENRYYKSLFHEKRDEDSLKAICNNYIEGLEWTFKYYSSACPNWKWSYKYHYPPLLIDLVDFLPDFDMVFVKEDKESYSSNLQLAYVLPPNQWTLLPSHVHKYMMTHHKDMYDTKMKFQWAFCKYFWESHICLDEVSSEQLGTWEEAFSKS